MSITRAVRRGLAVALASVTAAAGVVVLVAAPVEAAVVRPFTLNYDKEIYGDFYQTGNGNMQCPQGDDPEDPFGEPISTCAQSQARTNTTATGINDSYYMRWSDVDGSPATFNSSTATVTVPAGAKIDYARLNWAGDTGTVRLADGTISALPGCNTRQFLAGAGTSVLPSGTPESTSTRLTVGGVTTAYAPQVVSRDALANVPNSQPQFYTAYANVTAQVSANLTTGSAQTITLGNVWSPQGFGCFAGWSLVVVWYFDAPNVDAPAKREVYIYDGHVRQSSADAATTTTVTGFRVGDPNVRVGVTAYEGDFNIVGDAFSINGTATEDPLGAAVTNNFFVSNGQHAANPSVANNMSIDSKVIATNLITTGSTSATLTFSTSGDTYLAENLVLSVPIPSISVTKTLNAPGPYKPGDTVTYNFSVVSPGGSSATSVEVDDPLAANCDRIIGTLLADAPYTYSCTGVAGADDYTNTATATGDSSFGDPLTGTGEVAVTVVNPSIDITKVPDKATYTTGETITFTITVHNDGDSNITGITVSDPTVPSCANATIGTLGAGGSSSYTCTATAPITGDSNTATVNGTDVVGDPISDFATASAPTVGTISGRVFADRLNNGTYNPGSTQYDTGISGVTVTLTGTTTVGGSPVNIPATTAADGTFEFTSVQAGTYVVTETQPAAYDDGTDTPGTIGSSGGNDIVNITLTSGQSSTGNLFAERPTSSLAGNVYLDADNSGTINGAEAGLSGVTVTLTGTDSDGNAITLTATSAATTGLYSFPDLRAGTYTVTETQPGAYSDGKETVGTSSGTLSPPNAISAISLAARTNATGYLFGEYVAVSISGTVQDDGGNGIGNVSIALSGAATSTTTTAPNGTFTFTNLAPGTYTLTETQPTGYGDGPETNGTPAGNVSVNDVISGIVVSSGNTGTGYIFAEDRGSLAGVVFDDYDNDGIKDVGEPGLAASVHLTGTDANGTTVNQTVTSNGTTGIYTFPNLVGSASYTLTEDTPVNRLDGKETVGNTGGTLSPPNAIIGISLAGGEDATGYNFGEVVPSSISGLVTDNGSTPSPLAGVTITLTGLDDLGNPVNLTTTTGVDGTYTFTNLRPGGNYTLAETQPTGYGQGTSEAGSEGGDDSLPNYITNIDLDPNKSITGYNFTDNFTVLEGVVFQDNNRNGSQQVGEPGIPDVVLHLTGTDVNGLTVNATATSKGDGSYIFPELVAGTYSLTEEQPDNYNDGVDTPGNSGGSASGSDTITPIVLVAGENASGYTFAELPDSIGGRVWVDLDGDGVIDNDEPTFLPGVTITLQDGNGVQIGSPTTTDSNGHYTFPNLPLGNYIVVETQPAGYGSTTPNVVPVTLLQINPNTVDGKVINFGERHGSVGDFVWDDTNANGLQDSGEPGVAGVTVTLYNDAGSPITTTTTDSNGKYHFADLVAGTYYVGVTLPAGKSFTKPNVSGDATNSDVSWLTGVTAALAIEPGGDGTIPQLSDVDAGFVTKLIDLAVGVSTPTPSANVGQTVIFTSVVSNTGNTPVVGARTTITVPKGLRIDSAGGEAQPAASAQDINAAAAVLWQCTVAGQVATCVTDAVILPGQQLGAITVSTTATTTVTDTTAVANVTLADGTPDDNAANNAAVVTVGVTAGDDSGLVDTGADVKWPFFGGLFLLLVGAVTVFVTRRRRSGSD